MGWMRFLKSDDDVAVRMWLKRTETVIKSINLFISSDSNVIILSTLSEYYTAGISLYKDSLYINLYVMPIFDVWNRVWRVFIVTTYKVEQNAIKIHQIW